MTKPGSRECVFLGEEGCTAYEHRPAACRYYALGVMGVRKKERPNVEDVFFLVKESHCHGHNEPCTLTVRQYCAEQSVDKYDEMNRDWRDLIIKKRSSGPMVGNPSAGSMQLFDMCSYDMDSFRDFIQTDGFKDLFDVDANMLEMVLSDEEALLQFAYRFLKQVLFGESSIPVRKGAREWRLVQRHGIMKSRRDAAIAVHRSKHLTDDAAG